MKNVNDLITVDATRGMALYSAVQYTSGQQSGWLAGGWASTGLTALDGLGFGLRIYRVTRHMGQTAILNTICREIGTEGLGQLIFTDMSANESTIWMKYGRQGILNVAKSVGNVLGRSGELERLALMLALIDTIRASDKTVGPTIWNDVRSCGK